VAGYVAVAPATLAIGTGAGVALGVAMYAVAPLGLSKDATAPWLPGSAIDPVVALAWVLLIGGPMAAAVLAGRRYCGPVRPDEIDKARIWQCGVAGILATGVGALIVTVLGTGTVALMPRAAWLRVIGLLLGVFSSAAAIESSGPPRGGGGPAGPEPAPGPPGSGRLADAGLPR
jgi:hypothetical protein